MNSSLQRVLREAGKSMEQRIERTCSPVRQLSTAMSRRERVVMSAQTVSVRSKSWTTQLELPQNGGGRDVIAENRK